MDVRYETRLKFRQEVLPTQNPASEVVPSMVGNEDVLKRASMTALTEILATKQLRWFGHVSRMPEDRLPV